MNKRSAIVLTTCFGSILVFTGLTSAVTAEENILNKLNIKSTTPTEEVVEQKQKEETKTVSKIDPIAEVITYIKEQNIDKENKDWRSNLPIFKELKFDSHKQYFWTLVTNKGTLKLRFMPDVAPKHVSNYFYLTRLGFFDGLSFHRVISGFMAQGGCPVGRGTGDPGYRFAGEFDKQTRHDRPGLLSMANAGPNTDGSQFFITFVPTPHLDDNHSIFGEVVEGMDVLKTLEQFGSRGGQPREALNIEKATISAE